MSFNSKLGMALILGTSAISLAACSIGHPNSMPTGYTYHHEEYKSPTPTPSSKVTNKQRASMDMVQAEQFRNAVYDLLNKMTMRAGLPPKPVYVLAPDPLTTFYANIDNDLRESMRTLGYAISDVPVGSYVFAYSARELEQSDGIDIEEQPNVELIIRVFDAANPNARQLTEEKGRYFIKGVRSLYIKPTNYSSLPTFKRIRHQVEGFDAMDAPRTSDGRLESEANAKNMKISMSNEAAITEPAPDVNYTVQPIASVVVDSSGVSYDPMGGQTYQPSTPRPRISKHIDY